MSNRPKAIYEPGTLDRTRANLGDIDDEEAKRMAKILGGEVFVEKDRPIDYSAMPKKAYAKKGVATKNERVIHNTSSQSSSQSKVASDNLPYISDKVAQQIDKLMMASPYKIKPNYGVFNFIMKLNKSGRDKVAPSFIDYTLKTYIAHLSSFSESVKMIIQLAPATYQSRISEDPSVNMRFLKLVGNWQLHDVKSLYESLSRKSAEITVPMLVPIVRAMFRPMITLYYLGESRISHILHNIYEEISILPGVQKRKLEKIVKDASTEWMYIYERVIRGLYPLLMRMSCTVYVGYPEFFRAQISNILMFLAMTKFDLLTIEKAHKEEETETFVTQEDKALSAQLDSLEKPDDMPSIEPAATNEKDTNASSAEKAITGEKDDAVKSGLRLLEQLFPDAGFSRLSDMPDMYPYFQPIFDFDDEFALLSPKNPLQITIVLMRIIEDVFQGCRNINFNLDAEPTLCDDKDSLNDIFGDWAKYREELFERKYCGVLNDLVGRALSNPDYMNSQYAKKQLTELLWSAQYNFLPHLKFKQIILERPMNDSPYRSIFIRTDYLRRVFSELSKRIDAGAKTKAVLTVVANPWEPYKFSIQNEVSKRLDVLLGARRKTDTAATNANLIKYALRFIAVLDWWINNTTSPAYSITPNNYIYRTDDKGAVGYAGAVRTDQNRLFMQAVKDAIAKKQAQAQSKQQ
jgi:hypothetical protein